MEKNYFQKRNQSISDKILAFDFKLLLLILALGIISILAMYSSEMGQFSYHTQNHLYRFSIFFLIFIIISFFKIKLWYKSAYLFYFIVLILLFVVDSFGIIAAGSKRWINLLVFNLQPSELMKVALIIFLARFYNKIPHGDVNRIKFMAIPILVIFIPFALVLNQPDLGTAILIVISGFVVVWLSGFSMKYFVFSSLILTCLAPVVI